MRDIFLLFEKFKNRLKNLKINQYIFGPALGFVKLFDMQE